MPGRKFKRKPNAPPIEINKAWPITAVGHKYSGLPLKDRKRRLGRDPLCWCGVHHTASPTTRETPELFEPFKTRKQREGENYKRGKKR